MSRENAGGPWLEIVHWRGAQKYRKINPPWLLLYTSLHDDPAWLTMAPASRDLLIQIWIYAGRTTMDGRIWGDPAYLREVLPVAGAIEDLLVPLLTAETLRHKTPFLRYVGETEKPKPKTEPKPKPKPRPKPKRKREAQTQREGEGEGEAEAKAKAKAKASAPGGAESRREREKADLTSSPQVQTESQAQPDYSQSPIIGPRERPSVRSADPPLSDAFGGAQVAGPKGPVDRPPTSVHPGDARLLGSCLGPYARGRMLPDAWQWAHEIFNALRFAFPANGRSGREEIGAFVSLYEGVLMSGLPDGVKIEILAHDLRTALEKGRKGSFRGNKGAVFTYIHHQRLQQALARCRAPP